MTDTEMVGKSTGRRIFLISKVQPPFFANRCGYREGSIFSLYSVSLDFHS